VSTRLLALFAVSAGCALLSLLVPLLATRPLIRAFERAGKTVRNYRGARVPLGLGATWFVWAVSAAMLLALAPALAATVPPEAQPVALALQYAAGIVLPAGVAFVALAGLADDLFGTPSERGLRGHFKALGEGRITTGLVKLAVIAVMSMWAALPLLMPERVAGAWTAGPSLFDWACASVLIAGSTNLLNLLDLRPGRALKAGIALVVLVLPALALSLPSLSGSPPPQGWEIASLVAVLALGPMLALMPADLLEVSMLGDAGANAAGFLTGLVLAHSLSTMTLAAAAVAVVVLNLMSEMISFSAVIDRTPVLHRLDMLGRRPEPPPPEPPEDLFGG
jgi:hypothetical protein